MSNFSPTVSQLNDCKILEFDISKLAHMYIVVHIAKNHTLQIDRKFFNYYYYM